MGHSSPHDQWRREGSVTVGRHLRFRNSAEIKPKECVKRAMRAYDSLHKARILPSFLRACFRPVYLRTVKDIEITPTDISSNALNVQVLSVLPRLATSTAFVGNLKIHPCVLNFLLFPPDLHASSSPRDDGLNKVCIFLTGGVSEVVKPLTGQKLTSQTFSVYIAHP